MRAKRSKESHSVVRMRGITKVHQSRGGEVVALANIDLDLKPGAFVAVMGPSGSGKSTMLGILGCLDQPSSGAVEIDGRPVQSLVPDQLAGIRNEKIGFVFQDFQLLPHHTALENVTLPLVYSSSPPANALQRGIAALRMVGLEGRAHHRPNEMSGGQKQRVALARALVNNPKLVLADEPTGALDRANGMAVMRIFDQLAMRGRTIVIVTHDPDVARRARRVIILEDGRITADGSASRVLGPQGGTPTREAS